MKSALRIFKALRIDYGQADHPVLLAVRHNDEEMPLVGRARARPTSCSRRSE